MERVNRSATSLRTRMTGADFMDRISFLSKRIEDLESVLNLKNKEIRRVESANKQLIHSMQKRDEIIASALEENRKLKENLRWYQRLLSQAKKVKEDGNISLNRSMTITVQKKSTGKVKENWQSESLVKAKFYEDFLNEDEGFAERFSSLEPQLQREFLQRVRTQSLEYSNLVDITLRLKKLIMATHNISVSLVLSDMLDKLVEETCDNLKCDRASVFIVDELNGELWTKSAKGTNQTIRIPIEKGICGYVASSGKSVNIEDAYKDSRFNKVVDIHTNYHTKSVLAIPMRDSAGRVIGVCEAINKLEGPFTPDDEGLFEMLATNAGSVLRNSIQNESAMQMQNRLQTLLDGVLELMDVETLPALVHTTVTRIQLLVSSPQVRLYLCKGDALVRIKEDGSEEISPVVGLAGQCVTTSSMMNIGNAYDDPVFNSQVDIDTSMPVILYPVVQSKTGSVLAVVELVNQKGIYGRTANHKAKIDPFENEVMGYFAKLLALALERVSMFHK